MTEGAIEGGAPKRGRRDPKLAAELLAQQMEEEMAQEVVNTPGDELELQAGHVFGRVGRVVFARTSSPLKVDDGEPHWFSFGLAEAIDDDTDLEAVYDEFRETCNSAVIGMAADMQEKLEAIRAEAAQRPITPQRRR